MSEQPIHVEREERDQFSGIRNENLERVEDRFNPAVFGGLPLDEEMASSTAEAPPPPPVSDQQAA
eukprot:12906765-Prorocentrum_lima.AAC.1